MALTLSTITLPTMEGYAPRIVGMNPIRIQCDGCLGIYEGDPNRRDAANIILCGIRFNSKLYHQDPRRLCGDCQKKGWTPGDE